MSYICAQRKHNNVQVWERVGSERILKTYKGIFEAYRPDPFGEYSGPFGEKLKKYEFDSAAELSSFKQMFESRGELLYESDIPSELKVLSTHYKDAKTPDLNYTVWDIEVDYDPLVGFSSIENPYAPINAVALYHMWNDTSVVLCVPPDNGEDYTAQVNELAQSTDTEIVICDNEQQLLMRLLFEFRNSDVISGWNSDMFDTPYLAKRVERVLGKKYLQYLSFPEASTPRYRTVEVYGTERTVVDIYGRISWDYMELFKKFQADEEPSYSLENISNKYLPELSKLSYSGTLAQLYNQDFMHFLKYNIRDTEVLKGLEQKFGYLKLANELYHLSLGQPTHIFGTIKLADLAIINYCHDVKDCKVPDWDRYKEDGSIKGAMVLHPQRGLHEWIGSIDITSLYPSSIRTVNISPDTLIGQFDGYVEDDDRGIHSAWKAVYEQDDTTQVTLAYDANGLTKRLGHTGFETHTGKEWYDILKERKWAMSGFGTIFTQEFTGFIPSVLTDWFTQRKKYKAKMGEYKDMMTREGSDKHHCKEMADYYDRLQYVFKIKLNSLYGALTNFYFRFFDLRLGQSTTATGRCILDHMGSETSNKLIGEYDIQSDAIAYGDTDSCYFKTYVEKSSKFKTKEERKVAAKIIADGIGNHVDSTFDDFCIRAFRVQPEFEGMIRCEREVVATGGLFVTKKRYVLKIYDKDGYSCDELKAMGLEMKKTTTPKAIQIFLEDVCNMILDGETEWDVIDDHIVKYRDHFLYQAPLEDVGMPKGVKKVESYTSAYKSDPNTRLPGHVAASINYNTCLEEFQDHDSMPITSGTKIRVYYLKTKYGRFKSIALPTDLTVIPEWFESNVLELVDRREQEQRLISKNLLKLLEPIGRKVPTKQTLLNDSLLDF